MDERQEAAVVEVPAPRVQVSVPVARPTPVGTRLLERWKTRRELVAKYFLGPALVDIGVIAIAAILLPGADGLLQSYNQLNTAALLAMAYSYPGIALYTGLSVYAILRKT